MQMDRRNGSERNPIPPFEVKDCALIPLATGLHSQNLLELRDHVARVPQQSLFHHYYEGLLRASFDDPIYHNDFAIWAERVLHDRPLAERLAGINPFLYPTLEKLRQQLLEVIEDRLAESETVPWARRGQEFHFLSSKTVIFDTRLRMRRPAEMKSILRRLTPGSIYFHFIEAQRREPVGKDDFSAWFMRWGPAYQPVCEALAAIDYPFLNLREIRQRLIDIAAGIADIRNGGNR